MATRSNYCYLHIYNYQMDETVHIALIASNSIDSPISTYIYTKAIA